VTLTEAADRLGVAPATLRHQIRNGSLEAVKVGRDWTVADEEVQRYAAFSLGKPGRRPRPDQLSLRLLDDE
jgi:excisionase family DNA binding protein